MLAVAGEGIVYLTTHHGETKSPQRARITNTVYCENLNMTDGRVNNTKRYIAWLSKCLHFKFGTNSVPEAI